MKKALLISTFVLVTGYLVFSAFYFKDKSGEEVCQGFEVVVSNAVYDQFIDTEDVVRKIKDKGLDPSNRLLSEVNTVEIEEFILGNKHIKKAEVFVTNKSKIRIVLEERKPILRVMPNSGEGYYVDSEAKVMPLSRRYAAYLPIVTGEIKESFATGELYKFALFLHDNEFWNAQVEQIIVRANGDVSFIPRVGDQTIILGSLTDVEEKLDKLMKFYKDGLNRIGWNQYSAINLKYNKQVVCTRK